MSPRYFSRGLSVVVLDGSCYSAICSDGSAEWSDGRCGDSVVIFLSVSGWSDGTTVFCHFIFCDHFVFCKSAIFF